MKEAQTRHSIDFLFYTVASPVVAFGTAVTRRFTSSLRFRQPGVVVARAMPLIVVTFGTTPIPFRRIAVSRDRLVGFFGSNAWKARLLLCRIAGGGDRTHTALRPQDFKSCASACSATPALRASARFYQARRRDVLYERFGRLHSPWCLGRSRFRNVKAEG